MFGLPLICYYDENVWQTSLCVHLCLRLWLCRLCRSSICRLLQIVRLLPCKLTLTCFPALWVNIWPQWEDMSPPSVMKWLPRLNWGRKNKGGPLLHEGKPLGSSSLCYGSTWCVEQEAYSLSLGRLGGSYLPVKPVIFNGFHFKRSIANLMSKNFM